MFSERRFCRSLRGQLLSLPETAASRVRLVVCRPRTSMNLIQAF